MTTTHSAPDGRRTDYPLGQEIAHAVTHGAGALLGVVALVLLVWRGVQAQDPWRIVAGAIYGTSLILLFSASSMYHALRPGRAKQVFQALDHAAIYLLIAGTYTPFALVTLRGPWGWSLLGIVWGLAAGGIVFEVLVRRRFLRQPVAGPVPGARLAGASIVAVPLVRHLPAPGPLLLLVGGLLLQRRRRHLRRPRPGLEPRHLALFGAGGGRRPLLLRLHLRDGLTGRPGGLPGPEKPAAVGVEHRLCYTCGSPGPAAGGAAGVSMPGTGQSPTRRTGSDMTSEPNDFQEPASQPDPQLASETPTPEVPGSPVVLPATTSPPPSSPPCWPSAGAAAPSEPRAGDKVDRHHRPDHGHGGDDRLRRPQRGADVDRGTAGTTRANWSTRSATTSTGTWPRARTAT